MICSFWLVSCLAKAGEVDRAEALFDQLAGYANDLGLLGEEIDTDGWRAAGELPAGVQPHRPDHGGVGDRPGAGCHGLGRRPAVTPTDCDVIILGGGRGAAGGTAPVTSRAAGCASRSSSASCSEGSAPSGRASRRRRFAPARRSRRRARRPAPARPCTAGVKAAKAFAWRHMVSTSDSGGGGPSRRGIDLMGDGPPGDRAGWSSATGLHGTGRGDLDPPPRSCRRSGAA